MAQKDYDISTWEKQWDKPSPALAAHFFAAMYLLSSITRIRFARYTFIGQIFTL